MSNKKNKNKASSPQVQPDDIFNVQKNLRKLRQGRSSYNASQTENTFFEPNNEPISSLKSEEKFSESFGSTFTESMYNRYDKLKDELNTEVKSIKDEINSQTKDIRKDLNDKIFELSKEKLSISLFWKIIAGLVSFVLILASVIYTLSYSEYGKDIKSNKEKIESLKDIGKNINDLEKKVENQSKDILKLDSLVSKRKK